MPTPNDRNIIVTVVSCAFMWCGLGRLGIVESGYRSLEVEERLLEVDESVLSMDSLREEAAEEEETIDMADVEDGGVDEAGVVVVVVVVLAVGRTWRQEV